MPTTWYSPEIFLSTFPWCRISFRESLQLIFNIDKKCYLSLKRLEYLSPCSYLLGLRRRFHVLKEKVYMYFNMKWLKPLPIVAVEMN